MASKLPETRFKPGDVVFINGTLTRGICGKIVQVLWTVETPTEYSYIVEYYKHIHDVQWELVEHEFQEHHLLPYDDAVKLLYLD